MQFTTPPRRGRRSKIDNYEWMTTRGSASTTSEHSESDLQSDPRSEVTGVYGIADRESVGLVCLSDSTENLSGNQMVSMAPPRACGLSRS